MAPAQDAFSVPEVLQDILLCLPLRQIIQARRVCHEFERLITTSVPIQRALFFQSYTPDALNWYPDNSDRGMKATEAGEWRMQKDGQHVRPILNPFIAQSTVPSDGWDYRGSTWYDSITELTGGFDLMASEDLPFSCSPDAFHVRTVLARHYNGTVKAMLVTNPPIAAATFVANRCDAIVHTKREGRGLKFESFMGSVNDAELNGISEVVGSLKWLVLRKSVDELTGHEMVKILESQVQKKERGKVNAGWFINGHILKR